MDNGIVNPEINSVTRLKTTKNMSHKRHEGNRFK